MSEAAVEAAPAAPESAAVEAAPVVETPAVVEATPPAPSYDDDPAFLAAVDQRAAAIVQARINQAAPPAVAAAAMPVDPATGMPIDLWAEDAGQALTDRFDRIEKLVEAVATQQQPIVANYESQQEAANRDMLEAAITDRWKPDTDGELTDDHKSAITHLAKALYPQAASMYGNGDIAGQHALDQAVAQVRSIASSGRGQAAIQQAADVAVVAGAPGEPGTGAGAAVVALFDKPLNPRELALKYSVRGN